MDTTTLSEADILDCGKLSTKRWPGGVTATTTDSRVINEAVRRLNEFYVPVADYAKTRCIDGRYDPEVDEAHLGPQVPGGAPGAAFAWRLGVDEGPIAAATFLVDAERMMDEFDRHGFAPGGHRDTNNAGKPGMVGCGAIDSIDSIVSAMMAHLDDHKRIVSLILGNAFNHHIYREMLGGASLVNFESDRYFAGREKILDILEQRFPGSVATLEGDHAEAVVVVNMVPHTTLASNRFAKEFNGTQAFGYDVWRSLEMANRLLARNDQTRLRQNFVMARVMTTVATLMSLTDDGSQSLVLRMPVQPAEL
jgi:hypothetical protein